MLSDIVKCNKVDVPTCSNIGMDQYLLIPFLMG